LSVDISLSGVRLALAHAVVSDQPLLLSLRLPAADIEAYQRQAPLKVHGRVAWQREDQGRVYCGAEFVGLSDEQRKRLKACFVYFRKSPEYA
jgi:hypothetical protein